MNALYVGAQFGKSPEVQPVQANSIRVVIGNQYGQEVIRPACPTAELFCEIAQTKTLTRQLITRIKRLGYRVEVVQTQPAEL